MDSNSKEPSSVEPVARVADWFDVADLARRYKTSIRHIYRMADRGQMPRGMKLGHLRRWPRQAIENWESNGCRPVPRPAASAQ